MVAILSINSAIKKLNNNVNKKLLVWNVYLFTCVYHLIIFKHKHNNIYNTTYNII